MLARLLRRLIAVQMLTGILLGWFLTAPSDAKPWLLVLWGLGFPLMSALAVTFMTALKSRAPGAQGMWWRSLPGEYWAGIRLYMLQQPWAVASPTFQPAPVATQPRIPVLLVHGYICNHRVWDAMGETLQQAGHPVLALNLEPLFTSIDDYAPRVEQAVTDLCRLTGSEKVALVGHSMGGLVIRAWLRAQGDARVARVITLGTPHAGTQILPHPSTPNGQQMAWHSDWLQTLAASESAATLSLIRIGLTQQDNIVFPQLEQVLEGVPVTVFKGLGHLALCLDSAVAAWVLQQLEGGSRTSPN